MKYKCSYLLLCAFAIINASNGNNITVSNVSLVNQNTANHTVMVQFTLSWQNSWRVSVGPSNWDAAWIFVKYRKTNTWLHAHLNANVNHIMPAGASVSTGLLFTLSPFHPTLNPGIGAFIYRSANGSGTFTVTNAQIQWMYGVNGLADNDMVDVQVFAIEMVYVPQGAFAVGDGNPGITYFTITTINTSNATIAPSGVGSLGGQAGGYPTGQIAPDFPAFPNGFDDFYCMKNELSQQGYVDFLNTLDRTQQTNRVSTNIAAGTTFVGNRYVMSNTTTINYRNGIRCDADISSSGSVLFYCDYDGDGIGGESGDGREIACNYTGWAGLIAYLDWAGLRPLSELEFEKCARGNQLPVSGEFAWGNTTIFPATSIINAGFNNEQPNSGANANYDGSLAGPIRVGSFAGPGTGRQQSGAGYYGAMELTGNLQERPVDIADTVGRAFVGSHGNGLLDANGDATNPDWPPPNSTIGAGGKGGQFQAGFSISFRPNYTGFISTTNQLYGVRGCRTAP